MSSAEKNKALVRRFLEAHAKGDLDALQEMLAPDFLNHNLLPGQEPDLEGYLRSFTQYHAAFSDTHYVIEKQVAEGDEVMTIFTASSIHDRGEWLGLVPAGKEFKALLILVHRIVGGKIAEEWSQGSGLAELTQRRLEQEMREREHLEQELRVARRIQQASLPEEVPTLEGWQISPYYRPAREVGGDFYDFFELEDGRVGVVVGDATGKGVSAALVAAATSSMVRAVAQALDSSSPGEVLARVNETLVARIPSNMFVTCFYAIVDPKSAGLRYANAGHDLPYLRGRSSDDAEELRARGMPLGLMPEMSYEENEIVLDAGDSVLFYSDGLVEAHDRHRHQMFGFPRLRALVAGHAEKRSFVTLLLAELYSFTGEEWEQEDDITLLMLRRFAR
ncbi:MAG TPA: SpoIIE family protein phosphatase [Rubrobacter sp.]|jgi:serine phosphatase RsbU (regulator of sigma subunit)/predicted ester cyclase